MSLNTSKVLATSLAALFAAQSVPVQAQGPTLQATTLSIAKPDPMVTTLEFMCQRLGEQNFQVTDETQGRFYVVEDCKITLSAPALSGKAKGDFGSVSGTDVTPAGIFQMFIGMGYNSEVYASGAVIHFDCEYDKERRPRRCNAIHGVYRGAPSEQRDVRLASTTPDDNRISNGCINLEDHIFAQVLDFNLKNIKIVGSEERIPYMVVFPENMHERTYEQQVAWLERNTARHMFLPGQEPSA